jgi:putative transposase
MKMWFTPQEFADAAIEGVLPTLPKTKRGVQDRISREGWQQHGKLARPRTGARGGGFEYHIQLLQIDEQLAYARQYVKVRPGSGLVTTETDTLTANGRRYRDARMAILSVADGFRCENGLSILASDAYFETLYNSGQVEIAPWVRQIKPHVDARTLARWRSAAARNGTDALGYDPAKSRKDTGVLSRAQEGEIKTFILALMAKNPFFSAKHVLEAVRAAFGSYLIVGQKAVPLPPLGTFQRAMRTWRVEYRNELVRLTDPDGYRSRIEFVATGTTTATRLNEVWQIDASPLDAIMLDGKRPTIYIAIDVYSRRVIILVTTTPRAEAVAMLIRKCLLAWGVPERIKTDNGSDFTARITQRLLTQLRIEIELSPPYTPRAKGIVERVIGTFQRDCAATLPGFVGHNVGDRRVIENRKAFQKRLGLDDAHLFDADLTPQEVAHYADNWASEIYGNAPHEGIGRRAPNEMAALHQGEVRRIGNTGGLDILLAPVAGKDGRRLVTKVGITVDGANYLIGTVMPGTSVFCRMDPADLGRLHVFAEDEETFLGHAVCPQLAGLDPIEVAGKVKAQQKAFLDGNLKPIRAAMRRIGPRDVAMAQIGGAQPGRLLPFAQPVITHDTPALDAAQRAVTPPSPAMSTRAQALHAQLQAERAPAPIAPPAENVRRLRKPETMHQRFKRALEIEQRLGSGQPCEDPDRAWLEVYRTSPEYRTLRREYDDSDGAMSL